MPTNTRPRILRTAVMIGALATVALLAAGCSGSPSSSSPRQASMARDVNLCARNDTGSPLKAEFTYFTTSDGSYQVNKKPVDIAPSKNECVVNEGVVSIGFTTPEGVPVSIDASNTLSSTYMSFKHNGTKNKVEDPDLAPGGNYFRADVGSWAIWYGLGVDTDTKNFFVTVTSPS